MVKSNGLAFGAMIGEVSGARSGAAHDSSADRSAPATAAIAPCRRQRDKSAAKPKANPHALRSLRLQIIFDGVFPAVAVVASGERVPRRAPSGERVPRRARTGESGGGVPGIGGGSAARTFALVHGAAERFSGPPATPTRGCFGAAVRLPSSRVPRFFVGDAEESLPLAWAELVGCTAPSAGWAACRR